MPASLPSMPLAPQPTPVEELARLRGALDPSTRVARSGPRLLVKRDDTIGFAFGGNKVRKMRLVAADALAQGADTLITSGGVQSNHARVTAAAAAKLGLQCILVANGAAPERPTANALLGRLLGADIRYVPERSDRAPAVEQAAAEVRRRGGKPYVIPIGASTPLGAAAFVDAVMELRDQVHPPDVIFHSTSSGGTQAGLVAGCHLAGWKTRVIGISADESSEALSGEIRAILAGMPPLLGLPDGHFDGVEVTVDDSFIGGGYGVATDASREAIDLAARTEAIFLDHTYTGKAMAGLIAYVRSGRVTSGNVLFWHTGGQVALFA